MIVIADQHIPFEDIATVNSIESISNTKPNSTVIFVFDIEVLKYTQANDISSAVVVKTIKDIIYASSFDAKYIIVDESLSVQAQKIAENYMFDSKILMIIDDENGIEKAALNEIDGVIYKDALKGICE